MAKDFGNTQDLVNIKDIKEGAVALKSGALRQVVMVGGTNFALKSEAEQEAILSSYQNFLNGLDFPVQTIIHSRKINIENYLKKLDLQSSKDPSPLIRNQAGEYIEFVRGFVEKNAIMEKTFLVIVPFTPISLPSAPSRETISGLIPFLKKNKEKKEEQKTSEEETIRFKENLAQLKQRTSQVIEGLSVVGLEASALDDEQLIELFYNFYNPEAVEKEEINLPQ